MTAARPTHASPRQGPRTPPRADLTSTPATAGEPILDAVGLRRRHHWPVGSTRCPHMHCVRATPRATPRLLGPDLAADRQGVQATPWRRIVSDRGGPVRGAAPETRQGCGRGFCNPIRAPHPSRPCIDLTPAWIAAPRVNQRGIPVAPVLVGLRAKNGLFRTSKPCLAILTRLGATGVAQHDVWNDPGGWGAPELTSRRPPVDHPPPSAIP